MKFVRLNKKSGSDDYVLCYREIVCLFCLFDLRLTSSNSHALQEVNDIYSLFLSRLSLQTKAYKHKTVQLLEWMYENNLTTQSVQSFWQV